MAHDASFATLNNVPLARLLPGAIGVLVLSAVSCLTAAAALAVCADDAVQVGDICVDKYEASVWSNPPGGNLGTQYGIGNTGYPCSQTGEDCNAIYAVSMEGLTPSQTITWFQAQRACVNVGKRLLTNAEWQMAAAGTPDTGGADDHATTCNTDLTVGITEAPSGSRTGCVSAWGVYDMVGNVWEWTADWVPRSAGCSPSHWAAFSDDEMCLSGADTHVPIPGSSDASRAGPGALLRGGAFSDGPLAGPLAVSGLVSPADSVVQGTGVGFRCGRPLR